MCIREGEEVSLCKQVSRRKGSFSLLGGYFENRHLVLSHLLFCLPALSRRPQSILLPYPLSAQMLGGRAGEKGHRQSPSVVTAPRGCGPHVLIGSFQPHQPLRQDSPRAATRKVR